MDELLDKIINLLEGTSYQPKVDALIAEHLMEKAFQMFVEENVWDWVNHPERVGVTFDLLQKVGVTWYRSTTVNFSFAVGEDGYPTDYLEILTQY